MGKRGYYAKLRVILQRRGGIEELSIEQLDLGVDKYGIKKIYPDAADDDRPEHQYLDMNDIQADRVDNYPDNIREIE